MADETYVATEADRPTCDIHTYHLDVKGVPAMYDGRTTLAGRWANMCQPCFQAVGVGLGTGKGQRILVGTKPTPDPERKRSQIQAAVNAGDLGMLQDLIGDDDPADYL